MARHLPGEGYPAPHCTEDDLRRIKVPTGPAPGALRRVRTQAERSADGNTLWPQAELLAQVTRWRVVLQPHRVTVKGIAEQDARALADRIGGTVDRSTVWVYADGTEVLGPWTAATANTHTLPEHLLGDGPCTESVKADRPNRADLETRCTLTTGTCNCTRRAGCLQANEDAFDDPDSD